MALDTALTFLSPVVEHTIGPIKTHICYALYCKSNLQNLKEEVGKLKNAGESLRHRMDEETRNGKVIEEYVRQWLLQVDGVIQKMERELAEDEDGAKKKCFVGLCPNFKSRYQLGKKAKEELATVTTTLDEHAKFGSISYRAAPPEMGVISTKGYQAMESRMPIFKDVINALKFADVNMVGVYGMGGIGKTTLVKEVAREAIENKLFDKMVFASVTRTPDIMKIQGEIADQLGLTFDEESEWGRATRLRERLKQEKKILIVLDDLWKKLDLTAVGVSLKDEQKECKMLLTSREFDVLSSEMDVQEKFSISALNNEEAWGLFMKTAGGKVVDPHVQPIAFKIATKCAGLPVAIVTIAKALKDKSLAQWKDALQELERPSPRNFTGVQGEVYSAIELSYKHLGSEELKSTFLLSSRMGYKASTENLLKYGLGSGLFSDVATIEEARNRLHSLLHKLKASSLLLDNDTSKQFSIHDVVRDVAISIAYRDCNVFVKSDAVELKWRDKESLKKCTEIWLHCDSIGLPGDLKYPQLKVFIVNSGDPSLEISQNIFGGMQKLKVLGLSNLSFSSLHSSLHFLKNLRSLFLHQSSLGDQIAVIGELKKLEILSFVKSDIKSLPREIGQLTKLKFLDLTDCSELEMIAPNVISSLLQLEELCMGNSFHDWDIEGKNNASLVELEHLSHLTNLDIHVPDSRVMSKDLFSRNLERYRIFIGDVWDWDGAYETSRTLKLKLDERAHHLEQGILMLLKKTEDLYLLELKGVKNVICELNREGLPFLKHLHLHNSPEIQYIIDTMDGVPSNIFLFPVLESLVLYNLVSLEKIYHGRLRTQSFGKLQSLEVENCNKLKNLFSLSMARGLLQLQSIKITSCLNIEEVVAEESEEFDSRNEGIDVMEFTQLRFISLQYLPHFRKFSREKTLKADVELGEIILNDELQTTIQLFDNKFVFPKLEELDLCAINTDRLWNGHLPAVSIQNLRRLVVVECENLKYIFSSSMVQSLVQLKHLTVRNCKSVEEIVVAEALIEEEITIKMLFPKLEEVKLRALPKLKQFCTGSLIECPLLKELSIWGCSDFQTFISDFRGTNLTTRNEAGELNVEEKCRNATQPLFDEKVIFPRLAKIQIHFMDNLENIWHNQLAAGSFRQLRSMSIWYCGELVNIFPSTVFGSCEGLIGEENQASDAFQLRDLELQGLQKLKQIWKEDPPGIHNFRNLHSISVSYCDILKNLFPLSVARDLPQLGKLDIEDCGSLREIVAKVADDEAAPRFEFPQLTSLRLANLREFRNFYPGKHTWVCPILKSLAVYGEDRHDQSTQQPFFFVEKAISNLEELTLGGRGTSTTSIIRWHSQLRPDFDSRLKVLKLQDFKKNSDPIPFGFLQRLRNLETLSLTRISLKRLFLNGGLVDEEHTWMPEPLTNLVIASVHDIRHLWEEDHPLVPLFHNLKTLKVDSCHSLVNLTPSSSSFQNLSTLEVIFCHGLLNLITSSIAKSLVQLVKLSIIYCKNVTEIVAKQEDETNNEIVFSKLEYLELVTLESLTSFCSGNYILKFPSLKEMVVEGCPQMTIFSRGALSTPKLQGVCWQRHPKNKRCWQGNLNSTILQLYTEMFGLDGLWPLKLSSFPQLKETWQGQVPVNFYSHLGSIIVDECATLVSMAIPSHVLQFMNDLEFLEVSNCDSLEGIFDLEGLNAEEGHTRLFPKLTTLELIDLPRLRHIWNKDPEGILDFKNLAVLHVQNCSSLRSIVTPSMAWGLVQLQRIEIRNCPMVEEIITEEKAEQASIDRFIFPSLKVIILESLPNLANIYSGNGILEIPSLEEITIDSCPHMKTFVSSILREKDPSPINEGKLQRPGKEEHYISTAPFLNHKVAFPNLEKLSVEWNEIMEVTRHDQFQEELFCKLKVLGLLHLPSDYVNFPSDFLQRFTNLEKLVVNDASFEEIVLHEETNSGKKNIEFLARLKKLKLSRLSNLVHLSNENSQPCPVFQNLEELAVFECGRLEFLVPSSISFQSLTTLEVSKCHGLVSLMTSSTAKHFVQLTWMSITECDMVEEIVVNTEHDAENEVVFPKLKCLELHCLPNLTSFHLENCAFMLPSLEKVVVKGCPKMEIFSPGVISTPELERVKTDRDLKGYFWEDDLNSTIQKLFAETGNGVAQSKLPSSSKQPILACDAGQAKKDGLSVVSRGQAAEPLLVNETPDTIKDLPPIVEMIHGTNKHISKGVLNDKDVVNERGTTRVVPPDEGSCFKSLTCQHNQNLDLEQYRTQLKRYLGMSIESICKNDELSNMERAVDVLCHHSGDALETFILGDLRKQLTGLQDMNQSLSSVINFAQAELKFLLREKPDLSEMLDKQKLVLQADERKLSDLTQDEARLEMEIKILMEKKESVHSQKALAAKSIEMGKQKMIELKKAEYTCFQRQHEISKVNATLMQAKRILFE